MFVLLMKEILRRTDKNTFEGQVEINNENVCLCCNRNNDFYWNL